MDYMLAQTSESIAQVILITAIAFGLIISGLGFSISVLLALIRFERNRRLNPERLFARWQARAEHYVLFFVSIIVLILAIIVYEEQQDATEKLLDHNSTIAAGVTEIATLIKAQEALALGVLITIEQPQIRAAFYRILSRCGGTAAIRDRRIIAVAPLDNLTQTNGQWHVTHPTATDETPVMLALTDEYKDNGELRIRWRVYTIGPVTRWAKLEYGGGTIAANCVITTFRNEEQE